MYDPYPLRTVTFVCVDHSPDAEIPGPSLVPLGKWHSREECSREREGEQRTLWRRRHAGTETQP